MPVIASAAQKYTYSDVVKHEYEPSIAFCREQLVANEASAVDYAIGTVVGIVTATGKIKIQDASAVDGSQTADAIVISQVTAALNTDTSVLVLFRGPASVSKSALVLDATFDQPAELTAVYDALEAKGIQVLTTA